MWTPLSVGRLIFLLTLAAVMFLSVAQVNSYDFVSLPCCHNVSSQKVHKINACFEQKPRVDCDHHAFLVLNKKRQRCISPNSPWLQDLINEGKLKCPPVVSIDKAQEA